MENYLKNTYEQNIPVKTIEEGKNVSTVTNILAENV